MSIKGGVIQMVTAPVETGMMVEITITMMVNMSGDIGRDVWVGDDTGW
jgi:hypothetical protein